MDICLRIGTYRHIDSMTLKIRLSFLQLVRNSSTKPTTNGDIKPFINNRNPRNLELLRLERKPCGYYYDGKFLKFWNRLQLTDNSKFVTAEVVHNSGNVVLKASTKEWAIRKFLYGTTNTQAYIILARVFAERCLESGFSCFSCHDYKETDSFKVKKFLSTLEEEGLTLSEPEYFNIYDIWRKKHEKKPWTVLED